MWLSRARDRPLYGFARSQPPTQGVLRDAGILDFPFCLQRFYQQLANDLSGIRPIAPLVAHVINRTRKRFRDADVDAASHDVVTLGWAPTRSLLLLMNHHGLHI